MVSDVSPCQNRYQTKCRILFAFISMFYKISIDFSARCCLIYAVNSMDRFGHRNANDELDIYSLLVGQSMDSALNNTCRGTPNCRGFRFVSVLCPLRLFVFVVSFVVVFCLDKFLICLFCLYCFCFCY